MKLILTRHGETVENKKGIKQGQLPGRLSKEGIEQAKKLAKRLKNEKIDAIYCSDLKRAVDTTKEIAKYHKSIPIFFVQELREGGLGSFEGKINPNIDWENRPDDVESRESMRKRAKKILDIAYKKYPKNTVLFVAHGGINKALITIILKKPAKYMGTMDKQHNTSVNIFEIREDKQHKVHLLNCIKHLS